MSRLNDVVNWVYDCTLTIGKKQQAVGAKAPAKVETLPNGAFRVKASDFATASERSIPEADRKGFEALSVSGRELYLYGHDLAVVRPAVKSNPAIAILLKTPPKVDPATAKAHRRAAGLKLAAGRKAEKEAVNSMTRGIDAVLVKLGINPTGLSAAEKVQALAKAIK